VPKKMKKAETNNLKTRNINNMVKTRNINNMEQIMVFENFFVTIWD